MKAESSAATASGNATAEQGLRKLAPLFASGKARAPSVDAKSEGRPAPNKDHGIGTAPAASKPAADTKQESHKAGGNGILQFLRPIGIKGGSAAAASAPLQHDQAITITKPGQQLGNESKPATAGAGAAPGTSRPRPPEATEARPPAASVKSEGKKPQLLAALPPLPLALSSLPRQAVGAQGAAKAHEAAPAPLNAVAKTKQAKQPPPRTYQRRQQAQGRAGGKQGSRDMVAAGGDGEEDDEEEEVEEEEVEEVVGDSSGEEFDEESGEESDSESGSDWAPSPDARQGRKGAAGGRTRPLAVGVAAGCARRGGTRVQDKVAGGDAAKEGGARGGGKEGAAKRKRAVQPPPGSAAEEHRLEGGAPGRSTERPVGAAGRRAAGGGGGGGAAGLGEEEGSEKAGRGRSAPLQLPRLSLKLVEPRVALEMGGAGGARGGESEEGADDEGGGVLAKRARVPKARAFKSTGAYGTDGLDDTADDDSPEGNGVVGGAAAAAAAAAAAEVDEGDVQPGGVAAAAGAVPLVLGKAAMAAARRPASAATAVLLQLPPTFDLQGDVGVIGRVCPMPGALAALGTGTSAHADGAPASQEAPSDANPSDILTSQDTSLGGSAGGGGGGRTDALAEAVLSAGGLGLDLKGEVLRLRHVSLPGAAMVVRMDAKGGKVTSAEVERVFGTAIIAVPHEHQQQQQQQQQRPGAGAGASRAAADDGMDVDSVGDPYGDPYGWAGEDSGDEGGVGGGGGVRKRKGGGHGGEGEEDGEEEGEEGKGGKGGKGGKRGGAVKKTGGGRGGAGGRGGVRVGKGAAGGKRKPAGRGRGRGGGKAGGKKK